MDNQGGGLMLLPPAPGKCQECAVEHDPAQPHNQQSFYYQFKFNAQHGRSPKWADAMAHCTPEMRALWIKHLRVQAKKAGIKIELPEEN